MTKHVLKIAILITGLIILCGCTSFFPLSSNTQIDAAHTKLEHINEETIEITPPNSEE